MVTRNNMNMQLPYHIADGCGVDFVRAKFMPDKSAEFPDLMHNIVQLLRLKVYQFRFFCMRNQNKPGMKKAVVKQQQLTIMGMPHFDTVRGQPRIEAETSLFYTHMFLFFDGVAKIHQLLRCCNCLAASTYVSTFHCPAITRLAFGAFCLAIYFDTFCESIILY
jgi:hypothetical protein